MGGVSRRLVAVAAGVLALNSLPSGAAELIARAEAARHALVVTTSPDAGALGEALADLYGFEVVRLVNPTLDELQDAMYLQIRDRVQPYDQLVVHLSLPIFWGFPAYFVPSDGVKGESWTGLDLREFVRWLNSMPTGSALVTFATCNLRDTAGESLLEQLSDGDRPGPVEVLLACDYEAVEAARRMSDASLMEWNGDGLAGAMAEVLANAAQHDHAGAESGEDSLSIPARELAQRVDEALGTFELGYSVVPFGEEPIFRFVHIGTEDEYRARYEAATDYEALKAVLSDYLTAVGGEGAGPELIGLLRDIAVSPNAAAAGASLDAKQVLQLRSYALDSLARMTDEEAREAMRQIAESGTDEASIRTTAISALSKGPNPDDLGLLRQLVTDPDASVREAAVRGLARARDNEAPALLAGLLPNEESSRVRSSMAQALSSWQREEDRVLFLESLEHPSWYVRREAVAALTKLAPHAATNERLLEVLGHDETDAVRQLAASALARTVLPEQREEIVDGLRELLQPLGVGDATRDRLRDAAATALARIGGEEAEKALRETLANESNPVTLRISAASGLGTLGSAEAVPELALAAKAPNPILRREAIDALGAIGTDDTKPVIYEALSDESQEVRKLADVWVRALEIKPPTAQLDELIRDLGDRYNHPSARETLARNEDPATVDRVIEALGQESWFVRTQLIIVLGAIESDDARVVEALARMARDKDDQLRRSAVGALGRRGESALDLVVEATEDSEEQVRLAAVSALAEIGTPATREYLEKLAKADPSERVRSWAAETLTRSKFLPTTMRDRSKTKRGG